MTAKTSRSASVSYIRTISCGGCTVLVSANDQFQQHAALAHAQHARRLFAQGHGKGERLLFQDGHSVSFAGADGRCCNDVILLPGVGGLGYFPPASPISFSSAASIAFSPG